MMAGFADVRNLLTETNSRQGPGIMQVIYAGAAIAAVLGGIATAITMLVQSSVSPQIAKIEQVTSQLQEKAKANDEQDAADLQRLKTMRAQDLDTRLSNVMTSIETIKENLAWRPVVMADRKSK